MLFVMPNITDLLITLGIGAVAGWGASFIMNSKGGLIRNIIVGIIGGFVGRLVLQLVGGPLGIKVSETNIIGTILVSMAGACIFVWLVKKLIR